MRFGEILSVDRVTTSLGASDKHEALEALARLFVDLPTDDVLRVLEAREKLASTGVGSGVAIPHGRLAAAKTVQAALAIAPGGVPFDAIDAQPVSIFVTIVGPESQPGEHLKALARVSRLLRNAGIRQGLLAAPSREAAHAFVIAEDARH